MGEVYAEVELVNAIEQGMADRGLLRQDEVARMTVRALVDTGATESVLPGHVADGLRLQTRDSDIVMYADGREELVPVTDPVAIHAMERRVIEQCVVLGDEVLLGQVFLEQADLFVDARRQRLVGNPDHPAHRVIKIRRVSQVPAGVQTGLY